jgi:glycerophosphoryl diester phosphodiesterase
MVVYFSSDDQERFKLNLEKIKTYNSFVPRIKLIGHRGMGPSSNTRMITSDLLPENTLSSFKEAIILGVDGIEFDLINSRDNSIMVIHSDQLWLHVHDCPRDGSLLPPGETKDSYRVSKKTTNQLKEISVGPNQDKIPTLIEILHLVTEANEIRKHFGLKDLILNLEFKCSKKSELEITTTLENTLKELRDYMHEYPNSGINLEKIYFCSFNHNALVHLINIAREMQLRCIRIAPIIKTATLFGKDNVDLNYMVKEGVVSYDLEGLDNLRSLLLDHDQHFTAYDVILWDVYLPFIELAISRDKQLHTSTSDYRTYDIPSTFCVFLLKMSDKIPIYFKCDAVGNAMDLLIHKAKLLDRHEKNKKFLQRNIAIDGSLEKQLSNTSRGSSVLLSLLPKPNL